MLFQMMPKNWVHSLEKDVICVQVRDLCIRASRGIGMTRNAALGRALTWHAMTHAFGDPTERHA